MADNYPSDIDESRLAKESLAVDSFALPAVVQAAREKLADPEALYLSLVRALRRRKGFGIVFLQCTPAKGQQLFSKLQKDLPRKKIGTIKLEEPITNLLSLMDAKEDIETLNILFIEGIDKSLPPYMEKDQYGYYNLEVLPPILNHLNRKRENFRERFPYLCLVFVVPPFALKYFMYRAIDFFDWRSGIWTFAPEEGQLAQETTRALSEEYDKYVELSPEERTAKITEFQNLIEDKDQTDEQRSQLYAKQCLVFVAAQDFEVALRCCDDAIAFDSKNETAWFYKGVTLSRLGRNEEAIAAYDAALAIKPDKHEALYNKGVALSALGRKEEAITAYDAALAIKPDSHEALNNKSVALGALGRYDEAITALDAALAIKPDDHEALNNKGNALSALGRKEKAIAAYDAALAIKPDKHEALYNKGVALSALGRKEEAIAAYEAAIAIKPDNHEAFYNKGNALGDLGRKEEAIAAYEAAIAIKAGNHEAFNNKGVALRVLGRKEEAIAAYEAAIAIKPDKHEALNNKGNALSELGRNEEAIAAYDAALAIKPDDPGTLNRKDVALSALGRNEEAIAVCDQAIKANPNYDLARYNKACYLALTNKPDDALTCLQKAIELEGGTKYTEMAKTDTDFDSIRHDPRFQALIPTAE